MVGTIGGSQFIDLDRFSSGWGQMSTKFWRFAHYPESGNIAWLLLSILGTRDVVTLEFSVQRGPFDTQDLSRLGFIP